MRFEDSYAGQLRRALGNRRLIIPAARAIIRDESDRILLIRRSDNGRWALPAGSLELDESLMDCLVREVREETGLTAHSATPIAIYTEPRFHFTNEFGGKHQMLALLFRVTSWSGTVARTTDETTDARFFAPDELPDLQPFYVESLEDDANFDGHLIMK